jgi:hypothetical protein
MTKNTVRQNIPQDPRDPKDHLQSGYEEAPSEFNIPPCGIEDCDYTMFELFDKTIPFTSKIIRASTGKIELNKPYVILATGERFALAKSLKPPRDKRSKELVLPAISIRRANITHSYAEQTSRGINQTTGNLFIKRRFDPQDRDYQSLINKLGLKNLQSNNPTSSRPQGDFKNTLETLQGGLLEAHNNNNLFEIISIPQPQFFKATYEVVFWTKYTQHMNYMIETLMTSYLPQGRNWKLVTDKGYWFIATANDDFTRGDNFDDFTDSERLIRYNFTVDVKGYLLAGQGPSDLVPVRRWISAPNISFETSTFNSEIQPKNAIDKIQNKAENKFILTDIERDPATAQTPTTNQRLYYKKNIIDPITGKKNFKYVSILDSNQKSGETVFAASDIQTIEEFLLSLK